MPDFRIGDYGSIVLIAPLTPEACNWVDENIGADNGYQPMYPTVVAEHRYAPDIIAGITSAGFEIGED